MKIPILITALAASFLFAACDGPKTADEKMNAGADKIAEGVKEMAKAADEKTDKAVGDAKAAMDKVGEQTKAAAAEIKEEIKEAAEEAKQKVEGSVTPE